MPKISANIFRNDDKEMINKENSRLDHWWAIVCSRATMMETKGFGGPDLARRMYISHT